MRPFQPHLTVANRDIPAGASIEALQVLKRTQFFEDFQVDNITIFERINEKWKTASIFLYDNNRTATFRSSSYEVQT